MGKELNGLSQGRDSISIQLVFLVFNLTILIWLITAAIVISDSDEPRIVFQKEGSQLVVESQRPLSGFHYSWFTTDRSVDDCQVEQSLNKALEYENKVIIDLETILSPTVAICFQIKKSDKLFWYYYRTDIEISTHQQGRQLLVESNQDIASWEMAFISSQFACNSNNQDVYYQTASSQDLRKALVSLPKSQSQDWLCLKLKPSLSIFKPLFHLYRVDVEGPSIDIVWENGALGAISNEFDHDPSTWIHYPLDAEDLKQCSQPLDQTQTKKLIRRATVSKQFLKTNLNRYICFNVKDEKGNLGFNSTQIDSSQPPKIVVNKLQDSFIINSSHPVKFWAWRESIDPGDCNSSNQNLDNWLTKPAQQKSSRLIVPIPGNQSPNSWYCFNVETTTGQKIYKRVKVVENDQSPSLIGQSQPPSINGPSRNTLLILLLVVSTLLMLLRQKPVNY